MKGMSTAQSYESAFHKSFRRLAFPKDIGTFGKLHLLQGLFETHSRHVSGLELEGMGDEEVAEDPYEVRETDDVDVDRR